MLALVLAFATDITKLYFVQVDGMDVLAVKQACKFAKDHAVANGPIVSTMHLC
jgi:TPP-dependent pyruvate/acetoin dehydrogenase alpha subunit